MPGVSSVAAVDRLPLLGGEPTVTLTIDGYTPQRADDRPWAVRVVTTEDFFRAAGIPLIAGRRLQPADSASPAPLAIINQEMARRYWGEASRALGARVKLDGTDQGWAQIVGICGDVKRADLTGSNPQIYLSAAQLPTRTMAIVIRASAPDALQASVRAEVRATDPDVAIHDLRTMSKAFDEELASSRIITGMFTAFALLALVLAASGLYGVIAYSVSQRVQEIGIRMALGAVTSDIRRLIARQTLALVVVGCGLGLIGGALLARAASSLLYEVSPFDPTTYVAVAMILSTVAMCASYAPIRRATRIDPLAALRTE
jgi:putative ABC transport system permease protein